VYLTENARAGVRDRRRKKEVGQRTSGQSIPRRHATSSRISTFHFSTANHANPAQSRTALAVTPPRDTPRQTTSRRHANANTHHRIPWRHLIPDQPTPRQITPRRHGNSLRLIANHSAPRRHSRSAHSSTRRQRTPRRNRSHLDDTSKHRTSILGVKPHHSETAHRTSLLFSSPQHHTSVHCNPILGVIPVHCVALHFSAPQHSTTDAHHCKSRRHNRSLHSASRRHYIASRPNPILVAIATHPNTAHSIAFLGGNSPHCNSVHCSASVHPTAKPPQYSPVLDATPRHTSTLHHSASDQNKSRQRSPLLFSSPPHPRTRRFTSRHQFISWQATADLGFKPLRCTSAHSTSLLGFIARHHKAGHFSTARHNTPHRRNPLHSSAPSQIMPTHVTTRHHASAQTAQCNAPQFSPSRQNTTRHLGPHLDAKPTHNSATRSTSRRHSTAGHGTRQRFTARRHDTPRHVNSHLDGNPVQTSSIHSSSTKGGNRRSAPRFGGFPAALGSPSA
jgi:hypothetical protein